MKVMFVVHQLGFADHVSIAYLSAIAKARGHSTYFNNLGTHSLLEKVQEIQPDVVAFSANIVGFQAMCEQHRLAKEKHAYVSIMGGPFPTYYPETFSQSGMDAFCVGEGEYAFQDFLDCVAVGTSFEAVPNLITAKGINPARPLIDPLDQLPMPDRDLTIANSFLKDIPKKTVYATRGCPYKCAYCSNDYFQELYKGKGKIVRRFSVDRLIHEIKDIKSKYRMDFLKFGDDLFAPRIDDWLLEFCDRYPKEVGVPFNCYLRIDSITEDMIKLLKQAGCHSVHLSIDSLSKTVREKVLHRRMKDVDLEAILQMLDRHGIATWVNFMLAAPESALQDDLDTVLFSKRARITYNSYSTTVPMKGTALYNYCTEQGLIDLHSHLSDLDGCSKASTLACFNEKERGIRYNVFLLGSAVAKLPFPLDRLGMLLIYHIRPNKLFIKIHDMVYKHYIEKRIFLVSD